MKFKKGDIIFCQDKHAFRPVIYLGSEKVIASTTSARSVISKKEEQEILFIMYCRDVPGMIYKEEASWKIFVDVNDLQVYVALVNLNQWKKMPMRKLNDLIKKLQADSGSPASPPPRGTTRAKPKDPVPLPKRSPAVPNPPEGPPVPGQPDSGRFAGWV